MLRVLHKTDRVVIERVVMVKRHTKPTQKNPQGGIVEKEGSIHISNVMPVDPGSRQADARRRSRATRTASVAASASRAPSSRPRSRRSSETRGRWPTETDGAEKWLTTRRRRAATKATAKPQKAKPQLDEAEIAKKRAERAAKKAGKARRRRPRPPRTRPPARSRVRRACACQFEKEIAAALMKEFGLTNTMQVPRLAKITINMGLGEAMPNPKMHRHRRRGARAPSPVRSRW